MKQRVISSLIGLVVLAIVVLFYESVLFSLTITAIVLIAVYELLNATGLFQYKALNLLSAGYCVVIANAQSPFIRPHLPILVFCLITAFFLFVIKNHSELTFEKMSMGILFSVCVPLFLSTAIYSRNEFGSTKGLYFLLLGLGSAWLSDTGAYFAGYFFGKTKLSPEISPKKTVEGMVGGLLSATVFNLLLALLYSFVSNNALHKPIAINYLIVALASPVLAACGVLGDLVASVIKRQYNVKDYGHIMPGHGGVMDRFDSVLMTLPAVFILTNTFVVAV